MQDIRIAILGAGLIGTSWAALFRHHGATVTVWDPIAQARDAVQDRLTEPLAHLAALGSPSTTGSLIITDDLQHALAHAALVQENVPEDVPTKHALYTQIEPWLADDTVLASSTSALTWSDLAPGLTNPERLITAHPFNPPHLIPLVELFGHSALHLDRANALYKAAGRVPVTLRKEATGHIANRLASALWREAVHLVADGIADVEAVDTALVHGPGLRWSVVGAHMAYHLGGGAGGLEAYLAHLGPSQERRWRSLGTPSLTPETCAHLVAGMAQQTSGRSVAALEQDRDARLIEILRARALSNRTSDPDSSDAPNA